MYGSDGEHSLRKSSGTLRDAALSPPPSLSLTREYITEALAKSPDGGATLDLAYKGLTDVGESGAEELASIGLDEDADANGESTVVRIALAHNRLTTLPMAFSLLSRLRYLVLKNNNFSVFPDVLTVMPSLEILDISRNKIKRLPSQPGSLANLRVFSLTKNKLHRLPIYIAQFRQLSIFKVDQNPLEWPPPSVMETPKNLNDPHIMTDWIRHLQTWIEENSASGERKDSDDSLFSEQGRQSSLSRDISRGSTPLKVETPHHGRSYSIESNTSLYSPLDPSPGPSRSASEHSPRLHLDQFFSRISDKNVSRSSSRSPEASTSPHEDSILTNGTHAHPSRPLPHMNGNNGTRVPLKPPSVKKSLPDLRPSRLHLPNGSHRAAAASADHLPSSHYHHPFNSITDEPVSASPVSMDRPVPSMDTERNSYFRRLSTLSAATISQAIPPSLLAVVDAARGILFALSQIYQTLQHYTVYAIDERLSAVLLKVLGPASTYMSQLIHALDRFDTVSRRALPSALICRAVVENCRDNVTVFGKAVRVLSMQLKVLAKHDDVRYTRQMLLVLYGAMSEIAAAWQSMASHVEAVRPYLWDARPPPSSKYGSKTPTLRGTLATDKPRLPASAPPMSPTFSPIQETPSRSHLRTTATQRSLDLGKVHVSRRHAGSFSSKDVEIGKMLPSYVEPPPFPPSFNGGFQHSTPTQPRTMRRLVLPLGQHGSHDLQIGTHSRHGSQSSLLAPSNSSPQLGGAPSGSSTLVDKDLLGTMKAAVEAAPEIWELMDEMLDSEESNANGGEGGKASGKDEFREVLARAKDVTERLRQSIAAVQDGAHSQAVDGKALHDDAHIFVKVSVIDPASAPPPRVCHPPPGVLHPGTDNQCHKRASERGRDLTFTPTLTILSSSHV
ncbi:RAM signaling pathway protein-domain-containing protein [Cubamyces menziesii]|nr:RAM signaling pathway protein-domain-containing protein [Cubamyces menziesii]